MSLYHALGVDSLGDPFAHRESTQTTHANLLIHQPTSDVHKSTVVFLHGRGDTGHNVASYLLNNPVSKVAPLRLPELLPYTKFIFPTALKRNITAPGHHGLMHQWFTTTDSKVTELQEEIQVEGVKESSDYILEIIKAEIDEGVPPEKIHVMSFSQGAAMGAVVTLRYPGPGRLGGFVAMSGSMSFVNQYENIVAGGGGGKDVIDRLEMVLGTGRDSVTDDFVEGLLKTPVFVGHGIQDDRVPLKMGGRLYRIMKSSGFEDVHWAVYQERHIWCDEEIVDVVRWIAERGGETEKLGELRADVAGKRILSPELLKRLADGGLGL